MALRRISCSDFTPPYSTRPRPISRCTSCTQSKIAPLPDPEPATPNVIRLSVVSSGATRYRSAAAFPTICKAAATAKRSRGYMQRLLIQSTIFPTNPGGRSRLIPTVSAGALVSGSSGSHSVVSVNVTGVSYPSCFAHVMSVPMVTVLALRPKLPHFIGISVSSCACLHLADHLTHKSYPLPPVAWWIPMPTRIHLS